MKVLITGAGGFLGRSFARYFVQAGWSVVGMVRRPDQALAGLDLSWVVGELPGPTLAATLRQEQPDLLVHAASTAQVGLSVEAPLVDFEHSVRLVAHLFDDVRREAPACRVIHLSSAAVYGNPERLPVREELAPRPISPYGYHKLMAEQICSYYAELYGLQACSCRIFSAYGPGLHRQVIWDICRRSLAESEVRLMGTGEESRDFIFVEDVCQAVELVARRGDFRAGVYNVASGQQVTIATIARLVVALTGRQNQIVFTGARRSGDPLHWQADISRLERLGFVPAVGLEAGLARYVQWILGQQV